VSFNSRTQATGRAEAASEPSVVNGSTREPALVVESGETIAGYTTQIFFSGTDNTRVLTSAAPYTRAHPRPTRRRTRTTPS
jgi:hypothetical protein